MYKPTCSLLDSLQHQAEDDTTLRLLGDNLDDGVGVLLTHKMEAQLEELEKEINEKIKAYFGRAADDPPADNTAQIEDLVDEYKLKKEQLYGKLAHEHGEKQVEQVYHQLGAGDRLPMAYLEILHETWDVVELDDLDEEPVVVSSVV